MTAAIAAHWLAEAVVRAIACLVGWLLCLRACLAAAAGRARLAGWLAGARRRLKEGGRAGGARVPYLVVGRQGGVPPARSQRSHQPERGG